MFYDAVDLPSQIKLHHAVYLKNDEDGHMERQSTLRATKLWRVMLLLFRIKF
jgi:hypothetical protein